MAPRGEYPSSYPPSLTPEQEAFLVSTIKEWGIAHGLAVRPPQSFTDQDPNGSLTTTAPVTLFPSTFPLQCYHEALMIQTAYNELYARIAQDEEWLGEVCQGLSKIDDFIGSLWSIHENIKAEGGYVQPLTLGIFRSDYMIHHPSNQSSPTIRQVEFNTIASSFGGLASRVSSLHRYLLQTAAYPREAAQVIHPDFLPSNSSIEKIADGLSAAHSAYGASKTGRLLCVLFIVQDEERNVFDQKHIEYALFASARAKIFRLPLSQVLKHAHVEGDQKVLVYSPPAFPERQYEVTTAYYRAGYSPTDYTGPDSWEARLQIERSAAIKCPSILTHLAGSKKVQQILATPHSEHLARFLPYPGLAQRVKNTFAPMFPLDEQSKAGREGRKLATDAETARRFVLKPQREGGGNNVYREKIPAFLNSIEKDKWPAYVLMEMIEPPAQRNAIMRNGEVQSGGVICELGVYGTILWKSGDGKGEKGKIIENDEAGYLLRTKGDGSDEGGVAAGFGSVDSCILIDV